jgi:hypothetical protein
MKSDRDIIRRNSHATPEMKSLKAQREFSVDKNLLNQNINSNNINIPVNTQTTTNNIPRANKKKILSSKEIFQNKVTEQLTNANSNSPVSIFKSPNSQIHIPLKVDYYSLNSPKSLFREQTGSSFLSSSLNIPIPNMNMNMKKKETVINTRSNLSKQLYK